MNSAHEDLFKLFLLLSQELPQLLLLVAQRILSLNLGARAMEPVEALVVIVGFSSSLSLFLTLPFTGRSTNM